MLVLAGDLGGSKTLLQIADGGAIASTALAEASFRSREFPSLEEMVKTFLADARVKQPIAAACIAAAGPVHGDEVRLTNLPWTLHAGSLREHLRTSRVRLINDMQGMAYGIATLKPAELEVLYAGAGEPAEGTRVLLGVGTGLGIGILINADGRDYALPSEGGHCDFSPRGLEQLELLGKLFADQRQVTWETLLSGAGLVRLYEQECVRRRMPARALTGMPAGGDPAAVISRHALDGRDDAAQAALERFVGLVGVKCAHMALTLFATGGVYLVGGIPAKILPALRTRVFLDAYLAHSTMGALLSRIPVNVVTNDKLALQGARALAATLTT